VVALALAGDAAACSCIAGVPIDRRLEEADAAFVGRLLAVRGTAYEFTVDQQVKGAVADVGDHMVVRSARDTAACGLRRSPPDEAVGVLLTRAGAGWTSSLCAQTTPGELLNAESPERGDRIKLAIGVAVLLAVLGYSLLRLRRRQRAVPGDSP
jgi:hypothetical protein